MLWLCVLGGMLLSSSADLSLEEMMWWSIVDFFLFLIFLLFDLVDSLDVDDDELLSGLILDELSFVKSLPLGFLSLLTGEAVLLRFISGFLNLSVI